VLGLYVVSTVDVLEAQRLSWFGHVQRMPDTRTVKKIFNWKPINKYHKKDPNTDERTTLNRTFAKRRSKTG
jgi:hypothetical protein